MEKTCVVKKILHSLQKKFHYMMVVIEGVLKIKLQLNTILVHWSRIGRPVGLN
jgi:hypothetical protein